jgi:ankyrin repeat protein
MIGDYKALIDHGSVTDVIALVNGGGDVNAVLHIEGGKQPKHFSALAYAAFRLQLEVARALVELGAHVRETRPHHVPAFSAAAFSGAGPGCHALLRFLWEQDPSDVKRCDSQSCTAAHYAASRNACEATLRMLHGWEVPMNTLNCKMRTPLHYTLDQGAHAATLFLVSEVGAPVGPHVATMIDAGDAAGIMTLHKEGIWTSVDEAIGTTMAQPPWSFTALAHATVRGQTGIMELLIADLGASVNERRQWFEVPAMAAAAAGSVQALRLLNDGDGAFRPQATNGRTPAHNAATCGSAQCLVYLQEHGCPMDGGDQEGYNPAHLAAHQGHDHIIKLLHGWGCDLGKPTAHGNTAAEYAKSQEHDGTSSLPPTLSLQLSLSLHISLSLSNPSLSTSIDSSVVLSFCLSFFLSVSFCPP